MGMALVELQVPPGAVPGSMVTFEVPGGQGQAQIPMGLTEGQTFKVQVGGGQVDVPPEPPLNVIDLQVPPGATAGSMITFTVPGGGECQTQVPAEVPGDMFGEMSSGTMLIELQVPPGAVPGSMVAFQAPNGMELQTQVPPGHAPGAIFQVQVPDSVAGLPPQNAQWNNGQQQSSLMDIPVPPGATPGSMITFQSPGGAMWQAAVPAGCQPGQTFQVQVPNAANGVEMPAPAPVPPPPVPAPVAPPQQEAGGQSFLLQTDAPPAPQGEKPNKKKIKKKKVRLLLNVLWNGIMHV